EAARMEVRAVNAAAEAIFSENGPGPVPVHAERIVSVPCGPGLTATSGKTVRVPLGKLYERLARCDSRDRKEGPGWSPATFTTRPPQRKGENVADLWLLVQDHDDGTPLAALPAAGQRLEWFAHSTFSSTDDAPRFRRVFPLSRPVPREE